MAIVQAMESHGTETRLVPVKLADECNCEFDQDPEYHDFLLGLEDLSPLQAATLIADIIRNEDSVGPVGGGSFFADGESLGERPLLGDWEDFGRFVASHNWRDPAGMVSLAMSVDDAAVQAWSGRRTRASARAIA
jgi:hypothetical protein